MGRNRKRTAFIGWTGCGKSTRLEEMILARHEKFKEPVIIFDPSNQTKWHKYPAIDFEMYKKMKSGIYRINSMDHKTFFDITFNNFKGGQAVCEDASNYLLPNVDREIYPNLVALRHPDHDIDIHFTGHTVKRLPTYIIEMLNELVLFKTGDIWEEISGRIPQRLRDEFKKCFERVNSHPDPFYWERFTISKTGEL